MRKFFNDRMTIFCFLAMVVIYLYWSPKEKPFEHLLREIARGWAIVFFFGAVLSLIFTGFYNIIGGFRNPALESHLEGAVDKDKIVAFLSKQRFRVRDHGFKIIADRGGWTSGAGILIRFALAGILLCLFFSVHLRQTAQINIFSGREFSVFGRDFEVEKIEVPLSDDLLLVGGAEDFRIDTIRVYFRHKQKEYTFGNTFPVPLSGLYFIPLEVGYRYILQLHYKGEDLSREVFLEVLPPGRAHMIDPGVGDLILGFKIHPLKTIKKGIVSGRVYNLKAPAYELVIQKTRSTKARGGVIIRPGESYSNKDLSLVLGQPEVFVRALVVQDPTVAVAYMFMIVLILGIALMPFKLWMFRQRIVVQKTEANWKVVLYRDQFRRWAERALEELIEELNNLSGDNEQQG